MANQGAKKRVEENAKRLALLLKLILVGLAAQIVSACIAFAKGSLSLWCIAGLVSTLGVSLICYSIITAAAKPVYDADSGEMLDGGADLNMGGICGYSHDILYITVFVQVTTLFSGWFWYTYLAVPGYALYKLMHKAVIPWFKQQASGGPKEPTMTEAMRKKLEKTEKRAERRRMKWS